MSGAGIPTQMRAVLLLGHGGYDRLVYREDVPVPKPGFGEVLIRVSAAAINNTDVNTRIGWYSKSVRAGTEAGVGRGFGGEVRDDASWTGTPVSFPLIQGADCCGRVVAVGEGVDPGRLEERVLVRPVMSSPVGPSFACRTFGSDCDGAFAEYAVAPASETYRVESGWSDADLASIPCAYSTAENMLHRAKVAADETVLVTGASGGVGSAAVQLAKRRRARVVALVGSGKAEAVRALGADAVVVRDAEQVKDIAPDSVDVVVDVVGGPQWPTLLAALRPGGRLTSAGAIAGPLVDLDLRTLYLKDLTLLGCTYQEEEVFANLVGYVERNELRPVVARIYPLRELAQAQRDFVEKRFTGKLVVDVETRP